MASIQSIEITEDYLYVNSDAHANSNNSMNMVFENYHTQYKLLHEYLKETNENEELVVQFVIDHQTTQHIHLYSYFISQKIRVRLHYKDDKISGDSVKSSNLNNDTYKNVSIRLKNIELLIEKEKFRFESNVRKKSPMFKLQLIIDSLIKHRKDRKKLQATLLNEIKKISSVQM